MRGWVQSYTTYTDSILTGGCQLRMSKALDWAVDHFDRNITEQGVDLYRQLFQHRMDCPRTSLISPYKNAEALEVAKELDAKIEALIGREGKLFKITFCDSKRPGHVWFCQSRSP